MARPTISLQAAIGPGTVAANTFLVGSSLLGGTDLLAGGLIVGQGTWAELADYADAISIRRGRQRQLEQFRAGTLGATLDNADRRFDPTWTTGPYSDGGASNVTSNRAVRIILTYGGVDYPRYYGFTDDFSPSYVYPEGGAASFTATDAFKIFTAIDPLEQAAQGAGEATGARIARILDLVGWSATLRDLDAGSATHSATTLAEPAATQMRLAADSERGDLYIGTDGKVVLRERFARLNASRSRFPQWVIGDGAGEMNPSAFQPTNDDALKRNDVNVARAGGSVVTRQDPAVVSAPYLARSYNRTDLTLADDAQVATYADWVLRLFKDQRPRVDWVEFEPDTDDSGLWPMICGARFGDRVTLNLTHPYDGSRWSGDYFIEGIDDDIPVMQAGAWRTRFYLSDAAGWPTNPFTIGSSLLGGTDLLI